MARLSQVLVSSQAQLKSIRRSSAPGIMMANCESLPPGAVGCTVGHKTPQVAKGPYLGPTVQRTALGASVSDYWREQPYTPMIAPLPI